ncbi:MAG: hypothetical protein NVS3B25_23190 [Hymenobacter sp.]
MLIREFGVEEINAQGVAKAFIEGSRMVGILDEHNIISDIDAMNSLQIPRRELSSPKPTVNIFREGVINASDKIENTGELGLPFTVTPQVENISMNSTPYLPDAQINEQQGISLKQLSEPSPDPDGKTDAITDLFGINVKSIETSNILPPLEASTIYQPTSIVTNETEPAPLPNQLSPPGEIRYQLQVSGPGIDSNLTITEEEDISIAMALLEKIKRHMKLQRGG